jgi:hypothetical protein
MKNNINELIINVKAFVFSLCYGAFCFLIRYYRIAKHTIEFKTTGDIRYLYEIEHYKEMKTFSRVGKFNAP